MLDVRKEDIEFLVTTNMVDEVENFLKEGKEKVNKVVSEIINKDIERIYFVGCGSSKGAGMTGKYVFDKYTMLSTNIHTGWDFVDNTPKGVNNKSMVILISQSGTTEEVVKAMEKANKLGAITVALCNKKDGNPLGEKSDITIDYNAEAMWICQLVAIYLILCKYVKEVYKDNKIDKLYDDLHKLSDVLKHHIENYEETAIKLAKEVKDWKGFYTVASGPLLPLAYKEGVITNIEFLWGHGSVVESGEFRHGPLEIVEEGVPFVFLKGTDESRHITERALDFVKKYKGEVLEFDYKELSMGLHPDLAPMVMFVPMEWFSYYFALVRDHNPDDRRYYGVVEY